MPVSLRSLNQITTLTSMGPDPRSTYDYALENELTAVPVDVTALTFGVGHQYQFGLSLLMRYADHVSAVFLDMRRSTGLSADGRRWVFSAQHERYRVAYPDLAEINCEIWKYRANANRKIMLFTGSESSIPYSDLVADARETYAIYAQVLTGDQQQKRRSSSGYGPLYDL